VLHGIECNLRVTSVLHAAPEISQAFFGYYVTEDGELGLGMSGRLLTEEQLFEKILDPLVFPGGRPPLRKQ
jgi:hypothetical protein